MSVVISTAKVKREKKGVLLGDTNEAQLTEAAPRNEPFVVESTDRGCTIRG